MHKLEILFVMGSEVVLSLWLSGSAKIVWSPVKIFLGLPHALYVGQGSMSMKSKELGTFNGRLFVVLDTVLAVIDRWIMCDSRKYPYPPHGRSLEIPKGRGSKQPKFIRESIKLNWKFQREGGGGGFKWKNLPWGRYGYFMESHDVLPIPALSSPTSPSAHCSPSLPSPLPHHSLCSSGGCANKLLFCPL